VSLADRVLTEYAGVGGRVAGARHPHRVPSSNVSVNRVMTKAQAAKFKDQQANRQSTRDQMRKIALESRRQLKTID